MGEQLLEIWYMQAYIPLHWARERESVCFLQRHRRASPSAGVLTARNRWTERSARWSDSMITPYITGSQPQAFILPKWTSVLDNYTKICILSSINTPLYFLHSQVEDYGRRCIFIAFIHFKTFKIGFLLPNNSPKNSPSSVFALSFSLSLSLMLKSGEFIGD